MRKRKYCKVCEQYDGDHAAGCPIGENEVMEMPPIEDVVVEIVSFEEAFGK